MLSVPYDGYLGNSADGNTLADLHAAADPDSNAAANGYEHTHAAADGYPAGGAHADSVSVVWGANAKVF